MTARDEEISWRARNGHPPRDDWTDREFSRYQYIRWINGA